MNQSWRWAGACSIDASHIRSGRECHDRATRHSFAVDGAAVLHSRQTGKSIVPSWPFHGEYASTARFVVDDPQATTNLVYLEEVFDRFAVFSDGIERLVLDYREALASADLFDGFVAPLVNSERAGRDREFSRTLHTYLGSEKVREAT